MKLSLILEEKIYIQSPYTHKQVPVLLNPLPQTIIRELESIANKLADPYEAQLGGCVYHNDVYVWDRYVLDHEHVIDQLLVSQGNDEKRIAFYIDIGRIVDGIVQKIIIKHSEFSTPPDVNVYQLSTCPIIKSTIDFLNKRNEQSLDQVGAT